MTAEDLTAYFKGERLYGDDFSPEQIAAWFEAEREGYANLGARDRASYQYGYSALNELHGFRYLPAEVRGLVLGFGAAYGDELLPIIDRCDEIVIVDPSQAFRVRDLHGVPVRYLQPRPDGTLALEAEAVDLVTCFGVLHHIPNVTAVVKEMARCLRQGGYALIREPIISMGDWRRPRPDRTKHERGIPAPILRRIVTSAGLTIMRESPCGFRPLGKLGAFTGRSIYGSRLLTLVDKALSQAFAWNRRYHAVGVLQKVQPGSLFLVLRKPI